MRIEIRVKGVEGIKEDENLGICVLVGEDYGTAIMTVNGIIQNIINTLCGHPDYIEESDKTNVDFLNRYLENSMKKLGGTWDTIKTEEYVGDWSYVSQH